MKNVSNIADILKNKKLTRNYRNTYEFQAYGNMLAEKFNDTKHRTLYIKLAKTTERKYLEIAKEFALGTGATTNKAKAFMWKLNELRNTKK